MDQLTTTNNQNTNLAPQDVWGCEGTAKSDIIIPRVALMQDLSPAVKDRKRMPGDIVHSMTGALLAPDGGGFEVIPFMTFREWLVFDVVNGKDKFRERVLITEENEGWSKEAVVDGFALRRFRALNFFAMLPGKLDEFPVLLTFKKSSYYAGRKLSTHFQMCQMKGRIPAGQVFMVQSATNTYEGNTFKVFNVESGRLSTPEEIEAARQWYFTLRGSDKVKFDDEVEFATIE